MRGRKPGRSVFGKPVLFTLGPELTTPYSLGILVSNFYHTLVIVSTEFWLRFENQIRPTGFAIIFYPSLPGPKGWLVFVWNCLIFFLGEYSSVSPEICRVLSQIQSRFLRGISGKNYSLSVRDFLRLTWCDSTSTLWMILDILRNHLQLDMRYHVVSWV